MRHPTPPQVLCPSPAARRGQRGSALILTLILLMAMAMIALGVMNLVGGVMQLSQRRMDSTEAFNMADAGVEMGRLWLSRQSAPPTLAALQFNDNFFGSSGTITDPFGTGSTATLTVRIDADAGNSDINSTQKRYLIEAKAVLPSGTSQTVRALVQQSSFGHYAVFVDTNPSGAYWANDQLVFDGPVHSNNSNGIANILVWHSEAGAKPIFTYNAPDAFTVSGPSIIYNKDAYAGAGTNTPPTTEADWQKIAAYGSAGIRTGTPTIPFPPSGTDKTQQRDRALGGLSVPGSTIASGVTVEPNGGIYIHCKNSSSATTPSPNPNNDIQQMVLGVDGSGNQTITIKQNNDLGVLTTTVVTLDKSDSPRVTKMSVNGAAAVVTPGATNGVVYCDGNIGSQNGDDGQIGANSAAKSGGLSGTVADGQSLTIATDPAKNCNINGDIKYKTGRQTDASGSPIPEVSDSTFTSKAGILGLVSNNVEVVDKHADGSSITAIEVDAAVFAYGTYDACDYFNRPLGTMLNMGSYLVGTRGIFASPTNGIPCSRLYDSRLGITPPPYFLTTSNQYEVLSWQHAAGML